MKTRQERELSEVGKKSEESGKRKSEGEQWKREENGFGR